VAQIHFTNTAPPIHSVQSDAVIPIPVNNSVNAMDFPELVDGIPFILGDDGSYDADLNRFFRECPSMGLRSLNSVRAYAHDILTWIRFLKERRGGKSLWRADRQDVIAFHRTRRLAAGPGQITASSWNRTVAALEKFYTWAWDEGLVSTTPLSRGTTAAPDRSAPRHMQRRSRSFRNSRLCGRCTWRRSSSSSNGSFRRRR
jgi:hypothetical protein